jgi:hypothetical protein
MEDGFGSRATTDWFAKNFVVSNDRERVRDRADDARM